LQFLQELHSQAEELHSQAEHQLYSQLKELLELPSVDILDESDELLKHKFQLVYAWGPQCPLPSLHERVMMVQHVLQVLCKDSEVRAELSGSLKRQWKPVDGVLENEAMSLTPHPERFGSLPSIRLIPGTIELLKHAPAVRFTGIPLPVQLNFETLAR
jgi:Protein of unknown function (DUF3638)